MSALPPVPGCKCSPRAVQFPSGLYLVHSGTCPRDAHNKVITYCGCTPAMASGPFITAHWKHSRSCAVAATYPVAAADIKFPGIEPDRCRHGEPIRGFCGECADEAHNRAAGK